MALSKKNFYSGCKIIKNYTLDNYINGYYFDKKLGQKVPINKGMNKYNKQFLLQIANLNMQFFGLLRANNIMVKLLKMHEHSSYGDLNILYNLIRAQGGTIRYNKILKQALKTYEIRKQIIYDTIKSDLDSQEDRVVRNKKLLDTLMIDFGFGALKEFIQNSTGRNIVDDIIQYSLDNNKNFDLKPTSPETETKTEFDEEAARAEIDAYYNNLDNEYIEYIIKTAEQQGIELFKQISSSLEQHHKQQEQMRIERKQRDDRYKQESKQQRTKQSIDIDNIELSKLINDNQVLSNYAHNGKDDNNRYYKGLSGKVVTDLRKLVDAIGGIGYYIAICKSTTVNYISKNEFDNSEFKVTTSILKAEWFSSLDDAEKALKLVKKQANFNDYNISIQKLQTKLTRTTGITIDNLEDTVRKKIAEQLQFNKKQFIHRLITSNLIDITTCKYDCKPVIKIVAYYKLNANKDLDIKYLIEKKSSNDNKRVIIPYCDKVFDWSIGTDFKYLMFTSNKEMLDIINTSCLNKSGYKTLIYESKLDISKELQEIKNKQATIFNEVAEHLYIKNNKIVEEGYIHSEFTRTKIISNMHKLRDQGLSTAYLISGTTSSGEVLFLNRSNKFMDYVSYNTTFITTPEETINTLKQSLSNKTKLVYAVFSLDLTQIN